MHAAGVADRFHSQMSLAVSDASAHRRSDARRLLRIDRIHIEGQMETGGTVRNKRDGLVHDASQTTFINIAHREGCDTGFAQDLTLAPIYVANATEHHVPPAYFDRVIEDVSK